MLKKLQKLEDNPKKWTHKFFKEINFIKNQILYITVIILHNLHISCTKK